MRMSPGLWVPARAPHQTGRALRVLWLSDMPDRPGGAGHLVMDEGCAVGSEGRAGFERQLRSSEAV